MVGNGILDDPEQLLLGIGRANGKAMQKLNHETGETLKRPRNANRGIHFDQDTLGSVNEDLQLAGFIGRRVKESQETLNKKRMISDQKLPRRLLDGLT